MNRTVCILAAAFAALTASFLSPGPVRALIANHQCSYCHNVHGATADVLLNASSVEALCLTCHGPGGISTLKADVHLNDRNSNYPAFRITCRQCHDPHDNLPNWVGGTNIKTVGSDQDGTGLARITTPNSGVRNVAFESRGPDAGQPTLHSFADNDEDGNLYYDGVCETCHTLTRFHRNNSSGGHAHNTGETCTRCHGHVDNFLQ